MLSTMLARLKIGTKVLLISGIALVGFIVVFATVMVADMVRGDVRDTQEAALGELMTVQNLSEDFLNARRREKDFLLRKDQSYADKHVEVSQAIGEEIAALQQADNPSIVEPLKQLQTTYEDYAARFATIVDDSVRMGLTEEDGLLGKLRQSVHAVEEELKSQNDPQLEISMLMMRRHEKDFLARVDQKYVDKLTAERAHFAELLQQSLVPPAIKTKLADLATAYEAAFIELAGLRLDIDGKLGALSDRYAEAEPILAAVREDAHQRYQAAVDEMHQVDAIARTAMIATIIAVCTVILGLAFLVGRGISRPIIQLAGAMERLSGGDKTVEVPVVGTDEVAQMADAFGVFRENMIKAEALAAKEAEAQRLQAERGLAIQGLTAQFDHDVTEVLRTVSAAATELQSTATSMTSTAEETNRQAGVVSSASEEASTNVQTVAAATEELSASISEISGRVSQSAEIAGRAVAEAGRTNTQVQGLAEAAQKIGEVVNLISDIASQTNLLALNATIEAARAGEAGKGFAVVASEVKNLATQTAKATEEITGQISGIQNATRESVTAIQSIGLTIGQINEVATAIAGAVEEQGAATQEIARNVQQAAAGTQEVSANIAGVSDAATSTGAAAEQVLGAASELSQQSETLRQKVETFLAAIKAA
jgi:methyl-accepting chemotaxis protein